MYNIRPSTLLEPNSNNGILSKHSSVVAIDADAVALPVSTSGNLIVYTANSSGVATDQIFTLKFIKNNIFLNEIIYLNSFRP